MASYSAATLAAKSRACAPEFGNQRRADADRARGVEHVHRRAVVARRDPERGVHLRRGGAADQQRQLEALPRHLLGHRHHLVERRRDQARQADHVGAVVVGRLQDLLERHHDAEVDDLEVVALQDHAHDVLADVVDVALDRRHDDLALGPRRRGLLGLDVGQQVGDRLLHDARALDHLRQEHLARAEEIADHVHAGHQRPFDDLDRPRDLLARLLGVLDDELVHALDQRMLQPLLDRPAAPFGVLRLGDLAGALVLGRELEQPLGGLGIAIEDHVLAGVAQLLRDLVVDLELAGIDDAHVHARLDGVIQEHRVHGLAHRLVAAEGEGEVADAARDLDVGAALLDLARRLDEVDAVVVVLLDAGGDGEDVGIEDDVLGREPDLVHQDVVGLGADLDLALLGVGLALLVERHDHDGGTVAAHLAGMLDERLDAFLHGDRVHDRLAGDALQPGLDHAPLGAVDHDRHAGDVGFGGDQLQERVHRQFGVQQALVHVDVDDLRAALDLLARDLDGGRVVAFQDQLLEAGRPGDIGALTDIDEGGALYAVFYV